MANSQALQAHATSFILPKVVVGEGGEEQHGNYLQVGVGSYEVAGGSKNEPLKKEGAHEVEMERKALREGRGSFVGGGGYYGGNEQQGKEGGDEVEVGRNGLQGSWGSYGVGGEKEGEGGRGGCSRGEGMECNSRARGKYKEEGVLPTLRGYEAIGGGHARETHAVPLPGSLLQVPLSPRSGRAVLGVGLLKDVGAADDHSIPNSAAAAAAASTVQPLPPPPPPPAAAAAASTVQPPPPPPAAAAAAPSSRKPSRISTLLQGFISRGGASSAAAAAAVPAALVDHQLISTPVLFHMQTPHDAPCAKLPPSPPPPLADEKLKILHLSPDDHREGKSTFFQATLNCLSLLYGLGILSSPYAVAKAGWMGAIISILVSTTYAYTAHLMAKCVEYDPACTNYQDIAKLTLGKKMRKVITALFYMELTGTLVGYCISMGDNLDYIFPHISFTLPGLSNRNFMICVVSLIILPSVWLRDLSALSFTSMWCIASSVLLLVAVMVAATVNHIGFHHPLPLIHIKGVPVAAGLYAFSYGGTSVFPSIYKSMRDPSKFTQVLILSFFIATASIGGLGVAGAYMFGEHTQSQVTLSMPVRFISTKIVLWMTILTPIFKFALQLSPITTAVEAQLYKHFNNTLTATNKTLLFAVSTLMRSSVLALIVIISMVLPYFDKVIALVGSSMTIAICMIFPCYFYLKIYWKRLSYITIVFIIALVFLGFIVGACGTLVAFQGLVNSKKHHLAS